MTRSPLALLALSTALTFAQAPLEIHRATYGAGTVQADVTERVRSLVANSGVDIEVNSNTLGLDPVPNARKTLRVEYSQGVTRRIATAGDFERLRIGSVAAQPLRITKAVYGDGRRMREVTDILNRRISGGALALAITSANLGGDPAPAAKKSIVVDYEYNGRPASVTVAEGQTLRLPGEAGPGALRILSATVTSDVTSKVSARVAHDTLELPVDASILGPGAGGTLTVDYELDGQRLSKTMRNGEVLRLNVSPPASTLRIFRATYGAGRRATEDVTRAVTEQVVDHTLHLTVNGQSLGGDPAPGLVKTLVIDYELDGRRQTLTARDTETVMIPPVTSLAILSATYGVPGRLIDATGAVQSRLSDRQVTVPVNSSTLGSDPAPGVVKTLSVVYEINGRRATATARDGETLRLPAGRAAPTTSAAPSAPAGPSGKSGTVCLYREPENRGESVCLAAGQEIAIIPKGESGFRSLRLNGAAAVTVFSEPNFGGSSETLTTDTPDLLTVPFSWWRYDSTARVQSIRAR